MVPFIHIEIIYGFNWDFLRFHLLNIPLLVSAVSVPNDTSHTTHGFPWTIKVAIAFCPYNFPSWEKLSIGRITNVLHATTCHMDDPCMLV